MSKVALGAALGLLLFFTYLTAVRPAYAFAYALCLLFLVAWAAAAGCRRPGSRFET